MGQAPSVYRESGRTLHEAIVNLEFLLRHYEDDACRVVLLQNSTKTITRINVLVHDKKIGSAKASLNVETFRWVVCFKAGWTFGDGYLP